MKDIIHTTFGGKVRVRACGILIKEDAVLLLKHEGVGKKGYLWAPPGGGVEFGESIKKTIVREFKEECNLTITVGEFILFNEFIAPPLHAIELFFKVSYVEGDLKIGNDPELIGKSLSDFHYFSKEEIINNKSTIHQSTLEILKKSIKKALN